MSDWDVQGKREVYVWPSKIRRGDFIDLNGNILKVITMQADCPRFDNLNARFIMFTLSTRDGYIVPKDNLYGLVKVFR